MKYYLYRSGSGENYTIYRVEGKVIELRDYTNIKWSKSIYIKTDFDRLIYNSDSFRETTLEEIALL